MEYDVILTREGRKWTAEVPALPGCITWGASRGEAMAMAEEAVRAWKASRRALRKRVPSTAPTIELARLRVG